jgi:hypothetical protein
MKQVFAYLAAYLPQNDRRSNGNRRTNDDSSTDYDKRVYSNRRINSIKIDNNRREESYKKS